MQVVGLPGTFCAMPLAGHGLNNVLYVFFWAACEAALPGGPAGRRVVEAFSPGWSSRSRVWSCQTGARCGGSPDMFISMLGVL